MQYIGTPEGQSGFSNYLPYGVTTTGEPPAVDDAAKPCLPSFNEDKISETYQYDINCWGKNIEDATEKWNALSAG